MRPDPPGVWNLRARLACQPHAASSRRTTATTARTDHLRDTGGMFHVLSDAFPAVRTTSPRHRGHGLSTGSCGARRSIDVTSGEGSSATPFAKKVVARRKRAINTLTRDRRRILAPTRTQRPQTDFSRPRLLLEYIGQHRSRHLDIRDGGAQASDSLDQCCFSPPASARHAGEIIAMI